MHLIVDIGTHQIKAGLFEGDKLLHTRVALNQDRLLQFVKDQKIEKAFISSKDPEKSREVLGVLTPLGIPGHLLDVKEFARLGTDETRHLLQPDRIANIFGALSLFPSNDCVIVDLGIKVRFDYVTKQGVYLGGADFPTFDSAFKLLEKSGFPDLGGQPPASLGKNQLEQSKSGCYFGVIGALERIVAELRLSSEAPSSVITLATGGPTYAAAIKKDLEDFIDSVDPHLTLIGLNQILKESEK